jgi:hypothetical protein
MLPMPPQMRREARRRFGRTACTFWIPLVTLGALALSLLLVGDAAAQTTAPPPQAAPGLESGDTAPPPGAPPASAAPIAPLAPTTGSAPAAAPAPALTATTAPLVLPAAPAPKHTPIYRKPWFWGAIGVVAVTGMVLMAVALANTDPSTPSTRLGDMRAF